MRCFGKIAVGLGLCLAGCGPKVATIQLDPPSVTLVLTPEPADGEAARDQRLRARDRALRAKVTAVPRDASGKALAGVAFAVTSSDPAVASATAGAKGEGSEVSIVGLKPGTATIRVEFKEKVAQVKVAVAEVAQVSLDLASTTMDLETKKAVVATVLDASHGELVVPVEWRSEDGNVAVVDSGTITAVGIGKTTVTAIVGSLRQDVDVVVRSPVFPAFLGALGTGAMVLRTDRKEEGSILRIDAKAFDYKQENPPQHCKGTHSVKGDHVQGACNWKKPNLYCEAPPCEDPTATVRLSFDLKLRSVEADGSVAYDLVVCQTTYFGRTTIENGCQILDDQCWKAVAGKGVDCTPRFLHSPWTKPSVAALTRFLGSIPKSEFVLPVSGTWGIKPWLSDKPEKKEWWFSIETEDDSCNGSSRLEVRDDGLAGSIGCGGGTDESGAYTPPTDLAFTLKVGSVADGALVYSPCVGTECAEERCWADSRVYDETFDCPAVKVELIAGAADRTLYEQAKRLLRAAHAKAWKTAGGELPMLFEGEPAKTPRTESEVFFGSFSKPAALATAKLLEPVIGRVAPTAWPGPTGFHVVVVVGDKVASVE